ncbi:MAG TPA: hypothetical protein VMD91_19230 [Candidatus Sulfotelmatobacter sp.]|nr:hypothetical protein [Candidatus Sulfotelmatobacter sp.]
MDALNKPYQPPQLFIPGANGEAAPPERLAAKLTDLAGAPYCVQPSSGGTDEDLPALAAILSHNDKPTPVLIYMNASHWVAVTGVASPPGNAHAVSGFFLQNPWPSQSYKPSAPHINSDSCGLGGRYGSPLEYASLYAWKNLYWGEGSESRAVVAPELNYPHGPALSPVDESVPPLPLTQESIAGVAWKRVAEHGLLKGPLSASLAYATTAKARPNTTYDARMGVNYYLVEFYDQDGTVLATARIDCREGELFGATLRRTWPGELDTASLVKPFIAALDIHDEDLSSLMDERQGESARWVWDPANSASPYYPTFVKPVGSSFLLIHSGVDAELVSRDDLINRARATPFPDRYLANLTRGSVVL